MLKLLTGSAAIRVLGAVSQLLLTLVVSRICGASEAGIFFFGYSVLMILSVLGRLGCDLSGLRAVATYLAADNIRAVQAVGRSRIALVASFSLLLSIVLAASAPAVAARTFGDSGLATLRLAALGVPAFALVGLISELLKGAQRAWLALLLQNTAIPAIAIPLFVVLNLRQSATSTLASAVVVGTAWCVAFVALLEWRSVYSARLNIDSPAGSSLALQDVLSLMRDAPTLLTLSLMPTLMQWIGSSMLAFSASPATVAGYSIAMRISIAVSIVHSAAASVVSPQMAIFHGAGDMKMLKRVSQQTGLLILGITWPLLLAMVVLAPWCMGLFGDDFAAFADVLRVLLVGQLVAALIGHSGTVLIMAGKYSTAQVGSVFAGMLLVLLSLVMIPPYGDIGAAIAMTTSVAAGHLLAFFLVRRLLGFWTVPTSLNELKSLGHQTLRAGP